MGVWKLWEAGLSIGGPQIWGPSAHSPHFGEGLYLGAQRYLLSTYCRYRAIMGQFYFRNLYLVKLRSTGPIRSTLGHQASHPGGLPEGGNPWGCASS